MKTITVLFLLASVAVVVGCGEDEKKTRYPGEMGAPCAAESDCNAGLLCSKVYDPTEDLSICFQECDNTPGSCPAGSFCAPAQGRVSDTFEFTCVRECTDMAFCEDLLPGADSCEEFTGYPAGKKGCGIGG